MQKLEKLVSRFRRPRQESKTQAGGIKQSAFEFPDLVPIGLDRENPGYRAPYYEISRIAFEQNTVQILRAIISQDFALGDERNLGDWCFRSIHIPKEPEERKRRVAEIAENGTDRTDTSHKSKYELVYEAVAKIGDVEPKDVISCMFGFFLTTTKDGYKLRPGEAGTNGLLIYDAKTEHGLRWIVNNEYTFMNQSQRNKALLAIIWLR